MINVLKTIATLLTGVVSLSVIICGAIHYLRAFIKYEKAKKPDRDLKKIEKLQNKLKGRK